MSAKTLKAIIAAVLLALTLAISATAPMTTPVEMADPGGTTVSGC